LELKKKSPTKFKNERGDIMFRGYVWNPITNSFQGLFEWSKGSVSIEEVYNQPESTTCVGVDSESDL